MLDGILNNNKPLHKHITISPTNYIKLIEIQTAYKIQTNEKLSLKELINIAINYFINDFENKQNENEFKAMELIEKEHDKIKY